MLSVLYFIGFGCGLVKFIDTEQDVYFNGNIFQTAIVTSRASQSSILRSILYSIYTAEKINGGLDRLKLPYFEHNLTLISFKCAVLILGNSRRQQEMQDNIILNINGINIVIMRNARNFGVEFDSEICFTQYIMKLIQRTCASLKMLYSNQNSFNP